MQKKKSLFGLTFSIVLIVLLTISCGKNGTTEPEIQGGRAEIIMFLATALENGFEIDSIYVEIQKDEITKSTNLTIQDTLATGTFENLEPGIWTINVEVYSEGTLIGEGTGEGEVIAGQLVTVNIEVEIGLGNIVIYVTWVLGEEAAEEIANIYAQNGFYLLNMKILYLEELENPETGDDIFSEEDYNEIKALFEQALELHPQNALANFGMGILEVASVNYDDEVWELINEFTQGGGGKRLLKNQYSFLIKASEVQASYFIHALRGDDDLKFATLQNLIDNNVLPKLENALVYLEKAENIVDTTFIPINTGEEILELDAGEICLFESSIYAVCAGFREITLYDVDILDENDSYDWLDSLQDDYDDWFIETVQIGDTLYIQKYWDYNEAVNDSIIISTVRNNIEYRDEFLAYRAGNSGAGIQDDLVAMIEKLTLARDKILAETDEQDNDIIKIEYLNELDNDIADHDENDPNFMQDWNTLDDVLNWFNGLITGPVTFTEDFDGDGEDEQFTIDLSAYFSPGLTDMKDYLPYHEWNDEMHIVLELDWEWDYDNPGGEYTYWDENGVEHTFTNVFYIYWNEWEYEVDEPIFFLDGPDGNHINLDEEMPYFPDYTFGGIFPGMTRDDWLALFGGE